MWVSLQFARNPGPDALLDPERYPDGEEQGLFESLFKLETIDPGRNE